MQDGLEGRGGTRTEELGEGLLQWQTGNKQDADLAGDG